MDTVTKKRIEIIADAPLVPRIAAACRSAGVGGWSIVPLLGGHGRSGDWTEDRLTGAASKVMLVAIAGEAVAARLVDALGPVLDSHRLLLAVSDVAVVRGGRFG